MASTCVTHLGCTRSPIGLLIRIVLAAVVLFTAANTANAQELELRFLDVGQGDAVLIRNAGKAALVDAGPSGGIVRQLQALGVDSLDLFVASHNHADHIGGAEAVLGRMPVRFYLDNGYPHTTQTQARVLALVRDRNVTYLAATPRAISLGDATLRIIPSPFDDQTAEQNNLSVTIVVERGEFRALLTGDSEIPLINALLTSGAVSDVDVLKAAHHGSRNGVTPAWLNRTKPEVVVISVGANNPYGHPAPWALRYYSAAGRRVLRTDVVGDVVITVGVDGCYEVATERTGAVSEPVTPTVQPTTPTPQPARRPCCRICRKGKACGDSCISRSYTCRKPPGCACNG